MDWDPRNFKKAMGDNLKGFALTFTKEKWEYFRVKTLSTFRLLMAKMHRCWGNRSAMAMAGAMCPPDPPLAKRMFTGRRCTFFDAWQSYLIFFPSFFFIVFLLLFLVSKFSITSIVKKIEE
jgi:hypothetical protein